MTTDNVATWTLVVLGVLIALDGLASLARPGMVYGEGVQIVLGVLAFVSPWVIGSPSSTGRRGRPGWSGS